VLNLLNVSLFFLGSFSVIEPKPDQPKLDLFFKIPSFPKSSFFVLSLFSPLSVRVEQTPQYEVF
jgi:hypothetical protein